MSIYQKYLTGEIEIRELSQKDFNKLVIEWYEDYKRKNGKLSFEKFLELIENNF